MLGIPSLDLAVGRADLPKLAETSEVTNNDMRPLVLALSFLAIKAVAYKLARACYRVIKEGMPFDAAKAFG